MSLKKKLGSLVLCSAILGMGTVAFASTQYVDGGVAKWDYGTGGGKVWSNLHHPDKTHRTSVQGASYVDSGWVAAGNTSYASAADRWYTADHSYWDVQ